MEDLSITQLINALSEILAAWPGRVALVIVLGLAFTRRPRL